MTTSTARAHWRLTTAPSFYQGYRVGLRYPSIQLTFTCPTFNTHQYAQIEGRLTKLLPTLIPPGETTHAAPISRQETALWFLNLTHRILLTQKTPLYDKPVLLGQDATHTSALIPCQPELAMPLASFIEALCNWLNQNTQPLPNRYTQPLLAQMNQLKSYGSTLPSNTPLFINAAYRNRIPFRMLPSRIVQFGHGSRSRWLQSTFSDHTPTLGAGLARNKLNSQALLRRAGLPTAPHQVVTSADAASKVATELGYPVVVKPADLDGGLGVAAGLLHDQEVRDSYEAARKLSPHVLVEKHVPGRDYRLTVMHNELLWAIERQPGGVMGDGLRTVEALLVQLNANPNRGVSGNSPLRKIALDAEALTLLRQQNLTHRSIPAQGQFVRLRRAANVASGGMPIAVLDKVHPDNAHLAIRAAQTFGLDIAGVDLLIPDISVSWRESGAIICEINGQPSIGQTTAPHLYETILRRLIPEDGRVPTFLVLGANDPQAWAAALQSALAATGLRVGVADNNGISLDGIPLSASPISPFAAGEALILNRQVDALVMTIQDTNLLKTGLPLENYDALILAGNNLQLPEGTDPSIVLSSLMDLLLSACDGNIYYGPDSSITPEQWPHTSAANWVEVSAGMSSAFLIAQTAIERRNSHQ